MVAIALNYNFLNGCNLQLKFVTLHLIRPLGVKERNFLGWKIEEPKVKHANKPIAKY